MKSPEALGNITDTEQNICSRHNAEKAVQALLDISRASNFQCACENPGKSTKAPHTFCAGGFVFDVFWSGLVGETLLRDRVQRLIALIRLKLAEVIFPGTRYFVIGIYDFLGEPNGKGKAAKQRD